MSTTIPHSRVANASGLATRSMVTFGVLTAAYAPINHTSCQMRSRRPIG